MKEAMWMQWISDSLAKGGRQMFRRLAVILAALVFTVVSSSGAFGQISSPPKSQAVVAQQTKVMEKKTVKKPAKRVKKKPIKKTK